MPRAVRRSLALGASALLAAGLAGCAGIGQPAPYDQPGINGLVIPTPSVDPDDFTGVVDNPWLPLEPGASWTFTVTADGQAVGTIESEVGPDAVDVAGVAATVVRTTRDLGGPPTTETAFYAQDDAGNVWLLGAEVDDATSWRAGEDGAEAGLAMPADPRLGDGWTTVSAPGLPRSTATIDEQSATLLRTRDEAATSTRKVYESGVGLVGIEDLDAGWTARRQ